MTLAGAIRRVGLLVPAGLAGLGNWSGRRLTGRWRRVRPAVSAGREGASLWARVMSCVLAGLEGRPVEVEVDVSPGVPAFELVGLAQATVREARERVRTAVRRSGFAFPLRRITVSLAPADLRKEGAQLDLALAVGLLVATGQAAPPGDDWAFLGGLGLDGRVEAVRGVLAMALACARGGVSRLVVAEAAAPQAALVTGLQVVPVRHLTEAAAVLGGRQPRAAGEVGGSRRPPACGPGRPGGSRRPPACGPVTPGDPSQAPACGPGMASGRRRAEADGPGEQGKGTAGRDLAEVEGLGQARLALEVAAAGGHHLLLVGPPGTGKTLLASCLPGILPPLSREEALEVTAIHDLAGLVRDGQGLAEERPFRAPHHTVSVAGLLGGGGERPRPGEVSLAHHGVLFLDEFPELARPVREALRQPLEEGCVTVARRHGVERFPARFGLVAAANPCPCGYFGGQDGRCTCTPAAVDRYRARLSGPLLDRLDLRVRVEESVPGSPRGERSAAVRDRVTAARERQRHRLRGTGLACNAQLAGARLREHVRLGPAVEEEWRQSVGRHGLSLRAAEAVLRVARTLADLRGAGDITREDVETALFLRSVGGRRGGVAGAA